ncbi:MAG: type II toxin-antitoxin system RelE/ParE family toxin [Thermoanaerobaculia bacterium]
MKRYRFLEEADAEFQEHILYYDAQAAGLGDKFIADVENIITQVREFPLSGGLVSPNLRQRVLRVFKHNILYVNTSEEIIIVAVAPQKCRPGYWRSRLKSIR